MTENKNIQNTQANLDLQGDSWVDREFSYPNRTIKKKTKFKYPAPIPPSNIKSMISWRIIQTANILRKIQA